MLGAWGGSGKALPVQVHPSPIALGLRRLRNAACACTSSLNPLLAGG
jgi:hypothetical protein